MDLVGSQISSDILVLDDFNLSNKLYLLNTFINDCATTSRGLPLEESFSDALTVQDDGSEASSFAPLTKFTEFCGKNCILEGSSHPTVTTIDDPWKEFDTSLVFGSGMISFWRLGVATYLMSVL